MDKERPEYKRVREEIAEELFFHDWDEENDFAINNASNGFWEEQTDEGFRRHYYRRADAILSIKGIEILDSDQILPDNPYLSSPDEVDAEVAYQEAQEKMLYTRYKRVI